MARLVLQKANHIELQVDPDTDRWVSVDNAAVVFVAFLKDATADLLPRMVKSLVHLKYFEQGASILTARKSVLIVPQATLGGKMKGKQLQYHGNIDKDLGKDLFAAFVHQVEEAVLTCDVASSDVIVEHGTYGNVQRMRNVCNDGPFTHIVDFTL